MYEPRFYRKQMKATDLVPFSVCVAETDLKIFADNDLSELAKESVIKYRQQIKKYIANKPEFYTSLVPIKQDLVAKPIVQHMIRATKQANVGPMAAIAGAISEYVGKDLLSHTNDLIIENGGDIFIKSRLPRSISVYAGRSSVTGLVLEIDSCKKGQGICTSAGNLGHSLSFGKADAVVIRSQDTLLADATATAIGNIIKTKNDIKKGLEYAQSINGVEGALIIISSSFGAWGNIKFKEC